MGDLNFADADKIWVGTEFDVLTIQFVKPINTIQSLVAAADTDLSLTWFSISAGVTHTVVKIENNAEDLTNWLSAGLVTLRFDAPIIELDFTDDANNIP